MLELDELKQKWAEQDRKLDESIRLNRELLSRASLRGAQSALWRMTMMAGLELAVWVVLVIWFGSFIYDHLGRPQMAVAGVLVDLYAISMAAAFARQIATERQIDYGLSVAVIQKEIEALRVMKIRATQWGVLAGTILWAPALMVTVDAVWGVEMNEMAWILSNVLFGMFAGAAIYWASKKYADRWEKARWFQGLMRDIAGQNLRAAQGFLAEMAEFAGER